MAFSRNILNEDFQSDILRQILNSDSLKRYHSISPFVGNNMRQRYKDAQRISSKIPKDIQYRVFQGYKLDLAKITDDDFIKQDWKSALKTIKTLLKNVKPQDDYKPIFAFWFNKNDELFALSKDNHLFLAYKPTYVVTPKSFDNFDFDNPNNIGVLPKEIKRQEESIRNNPVITERSLSSITSLDGAYAYILHDIPLDQKVYQFRRQNKPLYSSDPERRKADFDNIRKTKRNERKTEVNKRKAGRFEDPYKEDILEAFKKFEDVVKDIKLEKVDWHMMYNVSNFIKLFNNIVETYKKMYEANKEVLVPRYSMTSYEVEKRDSHKKNLDGYFKDLEKAYNNIKEYKKD